MQTPVPLEHFFYDFTMALTEPFLRMQLRGVLVDPQRREELKARFGAEKDEAATRLSAFAGRSVVAKKSISSPELIKLLYDDLKLPKQFHHKTGRLTADKLALQKLEAKVPEAMQATFNDIKDVRSLCTLISTFLEAPLDSDGRLRWSNNLAGASGDGRMSTSDSPWGTGVGVQNWDEECREIVVADPGCVFIYGDGEQADARCVAWLANDSNMMHAFTHGLSFYANVATLMLDYPPVTNEAELKALKKSPKYKLAKSTVHAAHYGMGKRRAALALRKPESVAEELMRRYHAQFPGIKSTFQHNVRVKLEKTKTLVTPFGRARTFNGRLDEVMPEAFAYEAAAIVADWLQIGLLRLGAFTRGLFEPRADHALAPYLTLGKPRFVPARQSMLSTIEPCINIHDGLLTQIRATDLKRGVDIVREALTYDIPFAAGPLAIPVDVKIGTRWGELASPTPEWIAKCQRDAYARQSAA